MKRATWLWILAAPLLLPALRSPAQRREAMQEVEKESIRRSLAFANPASPGRLTVDNVFGSIQVTGYDGATVELQAEKSIRAISKQDIEQAKKEVELRISQASGGIEVYVDGPFRVGDRGISIWRPRYLVNYDFQIRVPRACSLDLRTVNDGDIRVEGVGGDYEIENVNGKIQMADVSGSGKAGAVNGAVKVAFSRNPARDCTFSSLNGGIEAAFPADLSADFWFKTFNGHAYTDFPLLPLPRPASQPERRDGKFVYKSNGMYGGRVSRGGPQITFDSFNGNIRITSK
jgi:hypothetical protein